MALNYDYCCFGELPFGVMLVATFDTMAINGDCSGIFCTKSANYLNVGFCDVDFCNRGPPIVSLLFIQKKIVCAIAPIGFVRVF